MIELRRAEVRKIIRDHRGEVARMARELDVADQSIQDVLAGKKTSDRIMKHATARARELLAAKEAAARAAEQEPVSHAR